MQVTVGQWHFGDDESSPEGMARSPLAYEHRGSGLVALG